MHTIRLRGAWVVATRDGATTHVRKFGHPRTLDPNERLWLVCENIPAACEVRVNGTVVGTLTAGGRFTADVSAVLRPRNEVEFCVASAEPLGEVSLEIRAIE